MLTPLSCLRSLARGALKLLTAAGVPGPATAPGPSAHDSARPVVDPHGNGVRIGESNTPAPPPLAQRPRPSSAPPAARAPVLSAGSGVVRLQCRGVHHASPQAAEAAACDALDAAAVFAGRNAKLVKLRPRVRPPATVGALGTARGEVKRASWVPVRIRQAAVSAPLPDANEWPNNSEWDDHPGFVRLRGDVLSEHCDRIYRKWWPHKYDPDVPTDHSPEL